MIKTYERFPYNRFGHYRNIPIFIVYDSFLKSAQISLWLGNSFNKLNLLTISSVMFLWKFHGNFATFIHTIGHMHTILSHERAILCVCVRLHVHMGKSSTYKIDRQLQYNADYIV